MTTVVNPFIVRVAKLTSSDLKKPLVYSISTTDNGNINRGTMPETWTVGGRHPYVAHPIGRTQRGEVVYSVNSTPVAHTDAPPRRDSVRMCCDCAPAAKAESEDQL